MSTRVRNITGSAVNLPTPYRGLLGPGQGTILSDDPLTFIANVGGVRNVVGVFDIGPTVEPGVAANNPAPSASIPTYASTGARPDPATLPVGSQVFVTSDNASDFVGSDHLYHDGTGTLD
jgi:hypothetical protein